MISKGGITSALIARVGLGAAWATVVGPVVPGVSLWRIDNDETQTRLAVVPGNVGETHLLTQVVSRLALLV